MLTLETINSRPKTCQRCGGLFRVVYAKDSALQRKLMELHKDVNRRIEWVKLLHKATNCDLKDAKGTHMHYVSEVGKCHWCKSEIEIAEFVDCPKCKSLNIYPLASAVDKRKNNLI